MRQYNHLNHSERKVIQKMIWSNFSISDIARLIGCHKSTISRELNRNKSADKFYRSIEAQMKYKKRILGKKSGVGIQIEKNYDLYLYILEKLLKKWTPELISGRLKEEYPHDSRFHVSHETIYSWIYMLYKRDGIKLYTLLTQSKKIRYRRRYKRTRRIMIKDRKSIHSRPEEVETRDSIGHWEGDLIVGKNASGYIPTMVERKSRFLAAHKMNNKTPDVCNRSILEAMGNIDNSLIESITFDNGTEFAKFKNLEVACECDVYFADPYSSWQSGTNENTNMLIRRYFPKKTNFQNISEKCLNRVVFELNNRPRKVLNYLTPYEVFCNNSVALKT